MDLIAYSTKSLLTFGQLSIRYLVGWGATRSYLVFGEGSLNPIFFIYFQELLTLMSITSTHQEKIQNRVTASQTSLSLVLLYSRGRCLILQCSVKTDENKYTVINKKYCLPL